MTLTVVVAMFGLMMVQAQEQPEYSDARQSQCPSTERWESMLLSHGMRYPMMNHRDAFKLIHQATLGSEHAVADTAAASNWMMNEWSQLSTGPTEKLVDTLGVVGQYVRINLRPLKQQGGEPSHLTRVFIATANQHRGSEAELACGIAAIRSLAESRKVPWSIDSVTRFAREWGARGFPPVSHSDVYRTSYQPAYRVIALPLVDTILERLRK